MRPSKVFVACAVVVLISLLVRIDIFDPSVQSSEWNSTTVLRHLEIWNQEGAMKYHLNPVVTYPGAANMSIDNHASTQEGFLAYVGTSGEYYYTSYPQFGYIMPYVFFKILFVDPNIVGLRIFNVLIQVLTAFFVYKIIVYATKSTWAGFIGFSSFMLLPIGMHYYAYNYMSDMLAPLFFVSSAYLFLRLVTEKAFTRRLAFLFVINIFIMIYTEYLGLFVAGVMLLYALAHRRQHYARLVIWTCTLVPAATMFFIAYQYASVGTLDSFLQVMVDRYSRGYTPYSTIHAVRDLLAGYLRWYGPALVMLASLLMIRFILTIASRQEDSTVPYSGKSIRVGSMILFVPVLVHHVSILPWTAFHAQYFSTLKTLPGISFLIGIAFWYLVSRTKTAEPARLALLLGILFVGCFTWSAHMSTHVVDNGIRPYSYCEAGRQMGENAREDQVVFVKDSRLERHNFPISPVFVYCAKRNLALYTTESEAQNLMQRNGVRSAQIFTLTYFDYAGVNITDVETMEI